MNIEGILRSILLDIDGDLSALTRDQMIFKLETTRLQVVIAIRLCEETVELLRKSMELGNAR